MNEKVIKVLEFDKIRQMLSDHCGSSVAKTRALRLSPKADLEKIKILQKETEDAVSRSLKKGQPTFINPKDARDIAKHLSVGGVLGIPELLSVTDILRFSKRLRDYGIPEKETLTDSLTEEFSLLDPLPSLSKEISRCIISLDEIADDASPGLLAVRKEIKSTASGIQDRMQGLLNSLRDYLSDPIITQRSGRYCLPVLAGHKNKVPGMVHDTSSSGQTIFIEPAAIVDMNNRLRELEIKEREEIDHVLSELSLLVAQNIEPLVQNHRIILNLDFIFAKAALALDMNALPPEITEDGDVDLKAARHPLLDKNKCMPVDIRLGEDFNLLIITGPNTGGKTVSLKTLGLLALMAQSGLHIPAKDKSRLPLFYYIGADIGDEQSIEQSLSTFSSHMTNIRRILEDIGGERRPSERCLVLLDELCAGTDPSEGAALATSILDFLRSKNVKTLATTHYPELKAYAITTPGAENASMEFDVETLSPTYRLIIGAPGKSNAFAISKKLGIPDAILTNAEARLDESDIAVEELLSELETKRVEIEKAKLQILEDREEIASLRASIEKKEASLEKQRDDILKKANEKASNILKDAKDTADAAIRNINKYGTKDPDMSKLEKDRQNLGKKLSGTRNKSSNGFSAPSKSGSLKPENVRIGDTVKVISMNIEATVLSLPNEKGEVEVRMGIMNSRINIKDLAPIKEAAPTAKKTAKSSGTSSLSKAGTISMEIKLLGMNSDEAIAALGKYIDDAYVSGLNSVRIVHGKGSGVLRNVVADELRRNPVVKSYHLAEYGEGDTGVTIAEF